MKLKGMDGNGVGGCEYCGGGGTSKNHLTRPRRVMELARNATFNEAREGSQGAFTPIVLASLKY